MVPTKVALLLVALMASTSLSCLATEESSTYEEDAYEHGRMRRSGSSEEEEEVEVELGEAYKVVETDGGSMWVWRQKVEAIKNMAVGVAELELLPDGLLLPNYADSPKLAYVLQGSGYMGVVFPDVGGGTIQPYVIRVTNGDVVALPKGTIHWWYNDGEDVHRVLLVADTSLGVRHGYYSSFILAGGEGRHFGSLLHGFSEDALATAWGVDIEDIGSLLESQRGVTIIRASRPIRFPQPDQQQETRMERRRHMRHRYGAYDVDNIALEQSMMRTHSHHDAYIFHELKYTSPRNQPDFYREDGGFINVVSFQKLPALLNVGFSIAEVSLEKNAMFAPSFISNAHELIYITRGNGRIEVSGNDGFKVFDKEVYEGLFIIVPQYFPSIKIAGEQGLEWISILTSERPLISFLAGTNSVYCGIPQQVLANAFNVEEETIEKLGRQESIIFPPQQQQQRGSQDAHRYASRKEEARKWRVHSPQTKDEKFFPWLQILANVL